TSVITLVVFITVIIMNKLLNQRKFINFALFAIFLLWNWYQPLISDDFGRVSNDVLKNGTLFSVLQHSYYNWNGRLSAEILANVLFSKSYLNYFIPLINIVNSLALVAILNLLYELACGKKNNQENKFGVFSLLYLAYFILIGTFAQDFLWKTIILQYAWGALLLLTIIWRFYLNLEIKQNSPWWSILLYGLSGIFIGFYNEIYIAFVADLYLSTFIVWLIFKKPVRDLLKTQYIVFLLAVLIAGIISIKAPGNFKRQQTYFLNGHIPHYGVLVKFLMTYVQFFRYGYHVAFGVILLWIGIWTYKSCRIIPHNLTITLTLLLILINIHILSFVGIAYYSPISGRMLLIMDSVIFLTFFIFFQYKLRQFDFGNYKFLFYGFSLILIAYVSIAYYQLHKFNSMREQFIVNNTQQDLVVPKYCPNKLLKYTVYFDDINEDKNGFKNTGFATYYNRTSVVIGACSE